MSQSNADVWDGLETGDQVLWDGIEQPVTITAGVVDYQEEHGDDANIVMAEGPRGGEKMLVQNRHNPDHINVTGMTLSQMQGGGEWIENLRVVG